MYGNRGRRRVPSEIEQTSAHAIRCRGKIPGGHRADHTRKYLTSGNSGFGGAVDAADVSHLGRDVDNGAGPKSIPLPNAAAIPRVRSRGRGQSSGRAGMVCSVRRIFANAAVGKFLAEKIVAWARIQKCEAPENL
jgi:hypothetical protein